MNRLTIPYYVYTGECPGEAQGYTSVRFYNQKITPKKGRRVRIENQTIGVASDPFPYSDREYDEGRSSERAKVNLGFRHDRNTLKVLAGDNEFYYEIKDGNTVIDSGKFIAHVETQEIVISCPFISYL